MKHASAVSAALYKQCDEIPLFLFDAVHFNAVSVLYTAFFVVFLLVSCGFCRPHQPVGAVSPTSHVHPSFNLTNPYSETRRVSQTLGRARQEGRQFAADVLLLQEAL